MDFKYIQKKIENSGELNKEDWELTVDSNLEETINYKRKKECDTLYIAGMIAILASYATIFSIDSPINLFSRCLYSTNLFFSLLTLFLLIWHKFRFPLRVRLLKENGWVTFENFKKRIDAFLEKLGIPIAASKTEDYLISGEIKNEKDLSEKIDKELEEIDKEFLEDYLTLMRYEIRDVLSDSLEKPLLNEKHPKLKFFFDRVSLQHTYYLCVITITLFIVALFYKVLQIWGVL